MKNPTKNPRTPRNRPNHRRIKERDYRFTRRSLSLLTVVLVALLSATLPSSAEDIFQNLRNSPPLDQSTDTELKRPASEQDTAADTGVTVTAVKPVVRSETDIVEMTFRPGDTVVYGIPPLRLILPPVENEPVSGDRTPDTHGDLRIKPVRKRTPGIRSMENLTAPFNNRFFIGLRWPGISIGMHEPPYSLEFKYLKDSSEEITIAGLRLYHHVIPLTRTNYYWGLDLSRIQFEGDVSKGEGTSTGVFFGVHRELSSRVSWSLDLGPYYIYLRDDATDVSANGLEFTLTTGLNLELW